METKGFKKVGSICGSILKLSREDFNTAIEYAERQSNYVHPLKNATATRTNEAGVRNLKIIDQLKELQLLIKQGAK